VLCSSALMPSNPPQHRSSLTCLQVNIHPLASTFFTDEFYG